MFTIFSSIILEHKHHRKMLSYRVQIFYTAIITIIICFGNLLTVATWSPQQRPKDATTPSKTQKYPSPSRYPLRHHNRDVNKESSKNQKVSDNFTHASKKNLRVVSWSSKSKSNNAAEGYSNENHPSTIMKTTNIKDKISIKRYQGMGAIIYNRKTWLHYAGNLFSIATSIPLLFSITPNTDLNRRRRFFTLVPYLVCSLFMVVTNEIIIFGQQYQQRGGRSVTTLNDIIAGGWGDEWRFKHVGIIEKNSNYPTTTKSTLIAADGEGGVWRIQKINNNTSIVKGWVRNIHRIKLFITPNPTHTNTTSFVTTLNTLITKNKIILTTSPMTRSKIRLNNVNTAGETSSNNAINANDIPVLSYTRMSCFVVYQLWILVRIVFIVLIGRYLHFLQIIRFTKKGGHHLQPKRSNATRRGVINITIND